jgi:hypothetical protein
MEIDAAMRLAAVQVQGHREDGQLGEHQQHRQHAPPADVEQAGTEEVEDRVGHCQNSRPVKACARLVWKT